MNDKLASVVAFAISSGVPFFSKGDGKIIIGDCQTTDKDIHSDEQASLETHKVSSFFSTPTLEDKKAIAMREATFAVNDAGFPSTTIALVKSDAVEYHKEVESTLDSSQKDGRKVGCPTINLMSVKEKISRIILENWLRTGESKMQTIEIRRLIDESKDIISGYYSISSNLSQMYSKLNVGDNPATYYPQISNHGDGYHYICQFSPFKYHDHYLVVAKNYNDLKINKVAWLTSNIDGYTDTYRANHDISWIGKPSLCQLRLLSEMWWAYKAFNLFIGNKEVRALANRAYYKACKELLASVKLINAKPELGIIFDRIKLGIVIANSKFHAKIQESDLKSLF